MITIEPEPRKAPPSCRCQIGAGNLARSTSLPVTVCCRKAASLIASGARGCNVLRFSIHALSASSGRKAGSIPTAAAARCRSEEHTSELQSHHDLVCRLLLEKKKKNKHITKIHKKKKKKKK